MSEVNLKPVDTSAEWGHLPTATREEIDIFETELRRIQAGLVDEKIFTEFRLRHGVYGQRQDRVQMQRIKIPMGRMTADQLVALADIAEEYAVGVLHVTTRQDFQCHFVDINDTPNLMRRLAAVGITTREACGNVIRNVTCCPCAGVCTDEAFDVAPHAHAMAYFMLRHPDAQNFGRKFKVAFSGCAGHACGLVKMHDLGLLAQTREIDGEIKRGFTVFVGGGLGTVPQQAKVLAEFATEEQLLPLAQAVSRVFARLGEKKNRNRARIKFLVSKLGIDEFRREVQEELKTLPHDDRHTAYLETLGDFAYQPAKAGMALNGSPLPDGFSDWYRTNVYHQTQGGYSTITLNTPLGDFTAMQGFQLAEIARRYVGDNIRLSVAQNIVLGSRPVLDLRLKPLAIRREITALAEKLGHDGKQSASRRENRHRYLYL